MKQATKEARVRAFSELSKYAAVADQFRLNRLASINLDLALSITVEVARVTVMARAIDPDCDGEFDLEAQELIHLSKKRPIETRVLFHAGVQADREAPHPAGVRIAPEVFQRRIDRVQQCLT